VLGQRPNQLEKQRADVSASANDLLDLRVPGGEVTEAGVRNNISVGILYLESWLRGVGAAAINNLMEDAATAEISRAQIWQWLRHGVRLSDGRPLTRDLVAALQAEELAKIRTVLGDGQFARGKFGPATRLFEQVATSPDFVEFLTLPAYEALDAAG
jgi:malate synthase